MRESRVETWVGAFVILLALAFVMVGLFQTSSSPRGGVVTYKAVFDSVDGIALNSDVKIGGVKVGSVANIEFSPNYQVIVTLHVQKGLVLPDDSTLAIATSGLIGDKYIEILPGCNSEALSPGGTFIQAKSAINIENLINKVVLAFGQKN